MIYPEQTQGVTRCTEWIVDEAGNKIVRWSECLHNACLQLAKYEDTGLIPEQVMQLKQQQSMKNLHDKIKTEAENADVLRYLDNAPETIQQLLLACIENRIVILPCRVGESLFVLCVNTDYCKDCKNFHLGCCGEDDYCITPDDDFELCPQCATTPLCEHQYWTIKQLKMTTLNSILLAVPLMNMKFFKDRETAQKALLDAVAKEYNKNQEKLH